MTEENRNIEEFKGYSLFTDITDEELRARNRAVIMANIAEEYTDKEKRINGAGVILMHGYFTCIPREERESVLRQFDKTMRERGFIETPKS